MSRLTFSDQVDRAVLYEAERQRYGEQRFAAFGVTLKHFREATAHWPAIGYQFDGEPIGGAMFDGNELHTMVLPEHQHRWLWLWPHTMRWLFALQDPARTRAELDNTSTIRFLDATGWSRVGADDQYLYFQISSTTPNRFVRRARPRADSAPSVAESA